MLVIYSTGFEISRHDVARTSHMARLGTINMWVQEMVLFMVFLLVFMGTFLVFLFIFSAMGDG
jgi:hypothetical protein